MFLDSFAFLVNLLDLFTGGCHLLGSWAASSSQTVLMEFPWESIETTGSKAPFFGSDTDWSVINNVSSNLG